MKDEQRVFLVKPGDFLVISGATEGDYEEMQAVGNWFKNMGLHVAIFDGDVDLNVLTREQILHLKKVSDDGAAQRGSTGGSEDQPGSEVQIRESSAVQEPEPERARRGNGTGGCTDPDDPRGFGIRDRRSTSQP